MIRGHSEGMVTRGTTTPNRLRRVDRWIATVHSTLLRSCEQPPLVVDLGYGESPITTIELYERLRRLRPDVQVVGLEIDPARVEQGVRFLSAPGRAESYRGLTFQLGGFELPVSRPPTLVRAFNVLRQYDEATAWRSWDRLCQGLAQGGLLLEGTCDEIGRRAVWVVLGCSPNAEARPGYPGQARRAQPHTITFAARVADLQRPSELAERLPKALIHHNVPGEPIHRFLTDFDRSWAVAAPHGVFGTRQRWIAAVEHLALTWPVITQPPAGGRSRWRLGEVTVLWTAVAPG